MLIRNTNSYNVLIEMTCSRSFNLPALTEKEINKENLFKLPEGVIVVNESNLLVEPKIYNGQTLESDIQDTTNMLLEG